MIANTSILIVDDDPRFRKTLSDILRAKGYQAITAAKGKVALDIVKKGLPAVALIDLKLEDISGLEIMSKIKERCPDTECIILTGYASQESAIEAVNLGAYSYVQKPYDVDQLVLTIDRAVEKWQARKKLRESAQFTSTLLNNSSSPVIVINPDTSVRYVNPALEKLTSFSSAELVGRKAPYPWWTQETVQKTSKDFEKALRKGAVRLEELFQKKNGERFWVETTSVPVRSNGKLQYYLANWVDITERKKIEQMKSDFVSLVSHELRTPLTSIGGYVDLILDGDVGEISKEQREFLEIISQNTQRLAVLINDVLDIEKIESRKIKLKLEKVNLNEVIEACVNTFEVMAQDKGLKLEKEIKVAQIEVLGDHDRLSQVFSNLLSNAIKYTKEGRVKVTAETKGRFASVTIEDTGVGMSREDLRRIFTRFFRAEDSYVRKTSGTGLGLSIAKATIETHNGDIKVESKLGVGSKFEVILPLLKEPKKGANGKENSFGRG